MLTHHTQVKDQDAHQIMDQDRAQGRSHASKRISGIGLIARRRFFIDEALTRTDLLSDRPEWPLSCYTGAGQGCTDTPKHLIGGVIEQSYEEVRTAYYLAKLNGQEEQAVSPRITDEHCSKV